MRQLVDIGMVWINPTGYRQLGFRHRVRFGAMVKTVHTIGYEGTDQEAFIHTLLFHRIRHLIDIRHRPISRKRGFSKNVLKSSLADEGIAYTHIQALGDPKEGRDAARRGAMEVFRAIYNRHLRGADAQAGLISAMTIARNSRAALMCFERDHSDCHRLLVVTQMVALGSFSVNHIQVPLLNKDHSHEQQAGACAIR